MTYMISNEDWVEAEKFLSGKITGSTFSKYPIGRTYPQTYKIKWMALRHHTFVIIDKVIYALATKQQFKRWTDGSLTYTKGINRRNQEVTIEIKTLFPEAKIQKEGLFFEHSKQMMQPLYPKQKIYSVVKKPSQALNSVLNSIQTWSLTQKLILSLRICLLLQNLHEKGVIYKNLTAESLDIEMNGLDIKAKFNNHLFCNFGSQEHPEEKPMIDWVKLVGFLSREALLNNVFTIDSDYFSLAIMLIFQIDILDEEIPQNYYEKYINDACEPLLLNRNADGDLSFQNRKTGLFMDVRDWLQNRLIDVDFELKDILFGMLHPAPEHRISISPLIVNLCEKLITKHDIGHELKKEFELLINRFKPRPKTMIFSAFDFPDPFLLYNRDNTPSEKNKFKI